MRMGLFNREITIQKRQVAKDSTFGTDVVTWVPLSVLAGSPEVAERFAAEVTDLQATRAEAEVRGGLILARNQVRVRMRWRGDVDSTMRVIVHGDTDRTLQIIGGPAEYGGRKQGIELMCEEISGGA